MQDSSRQVKKQKENTLIWAKLIVRSFLVVGALVLFWPALIEPFKFFEFWGVKDNFWEAVIGAWPWYLWAFGATTVILVKTEVEKNSESFSHKFFIGLFRSVKAGVVEEIVFRWLFFLGAIIVLPVINWLLGGFIGLELLRWLHQYIMCPIANFFTFGYLETYLMSSSGWQVGAAIIVSNNLFRDGHTRLGPLAFINAWFFGMYMYWVVFRYGIFPAMFIHFLYDFIIFTLNAVASSFVISRRRIKA